MTRIIISHSTGTSVETIYRDGDVQIATNDSIPTPDANKLIIAWTDSAARNNWIHLPGAYIREITKTPVNSPLAAGFVVATVRYGNGIVVRVPGRHFLKAEAFGENTLREYLGTNPQSGEGIHPGVARFAWEMDGGYQSFSLGSWRVDSLPQNGTTGYYVTDAVGRTFAVNPGDSISPQYKYTFAFSAASDAGTAAISVRDGSGNDLGVLMPDYPESLVIINERGNSVFSLSWASRSAGDATVTVEETPYTPESFGEINPGGTSQPTIVSNPVITANINQVGGVATITQPGSFTAGAVTSVRWRRGTTVVAGQTGNSYTFTSADIGQQIQAGLFDAVSGLTAWSNSTGVIVNPSSSGESAYTVSLLKPSGIGATEVATAAGAINGRYLGIMTQAEISTNAGYMTTGTDYQVAGQGNNSLGVDLVDWELADGESLVFQWRGVIPTVPAGQYQYIAAHFRRSPPERGFFLYYGNGNLTGGVRPGPDGTTGGNNGAYIDYQVAPGTTVTATLVLDAATKQAHMHVNSLAGKTATITPLNGSYKTNNDIGLIVGADQAGGTPLHASPIVAPVRHELVRIGVLPSGVSVAADKGRSLHDAVVADKDAVIGVGHYTGSAAPPPPPPSVTVATSPVISSPDLEVGTTATITTRGTFNGGTTNTNVWRRGTTELPGEVGLTYVLKSADIGANISAGTRDASGVTGWSNAIGPVIAAPSSNTQESQYSVSVLRSTGIAAGQINSDGGAIVGRYLGGLINSVAAQNAGFISTGQDANNAIGLDDIGWDLGGNESLIVQWAGVVPVPAAGVVGWIVDGLRANDPRRGFYMYMLNGTLYAGLRTNPDGASTATYTEAFRATPSSGDGNAYITLAVNGAAKTMHLWVGETAVVDKAVVAAGGSYKTLNDQGCVIGGRSLDGSTAASAAVAMRTKLFRAVVLPSGTALKADKGQSAHEALVFNTTTPLGNSYFTA